MAAKMLGDRNSKKKSKLEKSSKKGMTHNLLLGNKGNTKKNRAGSTLQGPVVSHAFGTACRDSANDRKGVAFKSKHEELQYRKDRNIPRFAPSPNITANRSPLPYKPRGASSAAQRRAVLRAKDDDSVIQHFRTKLSASTFRLLNEELYNTPIAYANQLLRDPSTFADYHNGYQQQLKQWPIKPYEVVLEALLKDRRGRFLANKAKSMPGYIPQSWIITDMGCGEAHISQQLVPKGYKVHSFDLCATNPHVTVADISNVPLESNSVDICVFSLSLMSTNYIECLYEAFRILKPKRLLKIVEVRSRIPNPRRFAELVEDIGFTTDYYDTVGDYFVAYDFIKCDGRAEPNRQPRRDPQEVLVPSQYKKR